MAELSRGDNRFEQPIAATRPLWQQLQEAAHAEAISAEQSLRDVDFESAAYFRGRSAAYREASEMAKDPQKLVGARED